MSALYAYPQAVPLALTARSPAGSQISPVNRQAWTPSSCQSAAGTASWCTPTGFHWWVPATRWVKDVWKKARVTVHPDKHPADKAEAYSTIFQDLSKRKEQLLGLGTWYKAHEAECDAVQAYLSFSCEDPEKDAWMSRQDLSVSFRAGRP